MGQAGEVLDGEDVVVGEVEHEEIGVFVEVLDCGDHVVLEEEVLEVGEAL